MNTIKRDGRSEEIDIDKIHRVLTWAADGLEDVSISEVELRSHIQFYEGIKTSDIQQILIKTAADMISDRAPDYQYFAARLDIFDLHKRVYGEWNRPLLSTIIKDNCSRGVYDSEVFDTYTAQDILYLEDRIDDSRDLTFSYAAAKQLESKYLVQDRSTGEVFETPQILYMTMAMALFYNMGGQDRLDRVVDFYNATSTFKISLPTPIMAGVRTRTKQFSSCFPAGSSVYTQHGLKPIENVSTEDKVLTQGGTFESVVSHTPLVSKAEGFISIRNAFSIPWDYESTSDHKVIALKRKNIASRKRYSVEEWVEMQEVEVGDFLNIPFNKHVANTSALKVPVPEGYTACADGLIRKLTTDTRGRSGLYDDKVKPFPATLEITPHLMRIIGYFLAEGHVNLKDNSFVFTFGENELEYHEDVKKYFEAFGLNVCENVTKKHAKAIRIYCKPFHDFLLREVGTGFNKMVLSDTLMRINPELQKQLLAGVIRGDGCVHHNGMTLSMSNKTLIHQLGLVCLRCGLYPSLGMREPDSTNSYAIEKIYTLCFGRQTENTDFLIDYVKKSLDKLDCTPRKNTYGLAKYMNGKYYAKVLGIKERKNTGEVVYDLSIDNDHTFTVSGICVHNCVLIDCGDSLNSINATSNSIVKYVSQRAGIGINGGRIRALGAKVRDGEISHTGCIPFYKLFAAALKSCSQGGVRGGAATLFYPFWHLEVESLLVLKNNKGVEENRIRHMDYAVQLNKLAYQRLIKGGNITLFSPEEVPELYDAFFEDQEKFQKLYEEAENNPAYRKKVVKAVDLFSLIVQERAGTGRVYIMNVDNVNEYGPFKPDVAPIHQSNLCVAPETHILTKQGDIPIGTLEGKQVEVWNGEEWSKTVVAKTGEGQPLLTVVTDSGQDLECTPYHKFYVKRDYWSPAVEVRAHQLKEGDKLIKLDLPRDIEQGEKHLDKAWLNGFFTGDGCSYKDKDIVYLYHGKRKLLDKIVSDHHDDISWIYTQENQNRVVLHVDGLLPKFTVPGVEADLSSKLEWLAGWADADGTLQKNGKNESVIVCSNNYTFLQKVQGMLRGIGISCKVGKGIDKGYQELPANDGTHDKKRFLCQETYRLIINSTNLLRLIDLGINFRRLAVTRSVPNRDARHYVKVVKVEDNGRTSDTYCVNEPKRHMAVFNGLLTGQCMEVALPTTPLESEDDMNGEIALCTLAAFNLGEIDDLDDLEHLADLLVDALNRILDYQNYPIKAAMKSAIGRRPLGIGVINYAYYLAKNGVDYSSGAANNLTHRLFEAIQYYLLKASNNLAKKNGACVYFDQTEYSDGILPIDNYCKAVDDLHTEPLHYDWESLRENIKKYGLANSTLSALMPSETSSQISNATNGIEPPRGYVSIKTSKDGALKQVVPDVKSLRMWYELLWQMPSNKGYLDLVAIMQKFVDQSISANTNYDPSKFEDGKVPTTLVLMDMLNAYKLGIKTLYYHNTRDGAGNDSIEKEDDGCSSGACKI